MLNTELLPAQVVFLQNPKKLKINEALSFVIRDLIIRRVLTLHKKRIFPNDRSRKTQKYTHLSKDINFLNYEAAVFEKNFLSPFSDVRNIQLKILSNFVLKRYSMPSAYIKSKLLQPLRELGYITNIPILKSFGVYSLTTKAKELVSEFEQIIDQYEQRFTSLIDGDKEEFYNAVKEIGTYIFIFEHKNPELYKDIESMIRRIFITKPLGPDKDLNEYFQAMTVDFGFHE
ncbi:MAG: hypothetical protein JEZ09_18440 [Salinivirgaceae bacterium]|nr:hypothetical protein [Salinivirgaceae bacterium]